jgi:HAD superfamily phosphatase (TIGR01668 family)
MFPGPGTYRREEMPSALRRFSPVEAFLSLADVDPQALSAAGKRLVLMDVDNTLLPRDADEAPQEAKDWVRACREAGLEVVFVSNTRRFERLERLAESMGASWERGKNKPSRSMFLQALSRTGVEPSQAVMIGDQLLTDVWGANRCGIDAIWVDRLPGPEFIGTRLISRNVERLLVLMLQQFAHADDALTEGAKPRFGLLASPGFRQFVKFGLVGVMSFVIDYSVMMTLLYGISGFRDAVGGWVMETLGDAATWAVNPETGTPDALHAALPVAAASGAVFGILNSFFWNRRWTFRILGAEDRAKQFRRFFLLSATGALLNVILTTLLFRVIPLPEKDATRLAKILATVAVAFWNFFGQKLYAFRRK